jgi:mannose-6-phosphate isomerase-like protein (cupin superfamily)
MKRNGRVNGMGEYTVKRIDELEAIYGGAFKRARAELGVSAFGMQIIDLPPSVTGYPEHDHGQDGQEEVYIVLRGSADIELDGEPVAMDPDTLVRVGAGTTRKLLPGANGARMLVIGGVPGKAYEAPAVTELGAPDPMAQ